MKPEIKVAEHSGFCFGVKRATETLEEKLKAKKNGERIYTLGNLIHNEDYLAMLERNGVKAIDADAIEEIAKSADENSAVTVFIRAHGVTKETEQLLTKLHSENPYFSFEDCTCPFVRKIHKIAEENSSDDNFFILIGAPEHPECIGIMSWFDGEKYVFADDIALDAFLKSDKAVNLHKKTPVVAVQTTQKPSQWQKCVEKIKKLYTKAIFFDTICNVTETRQSEAEKLAASCDGMVVIGGSESSNTKKLYDICRNACRLTVWIKNVSELDVGSFKNCKSIGIVAGASTPGHIIQEVVKTMSEINVKGENFEELLESSLKTLNTGDIVTGYVTSVTDAEIQLDIGAKVTGIIKAEQISDDPGFKLAENFKVGDEVEAFVIRVSDIEGVAELSKKRVDSDKNFKNIVGAKASGEVLKGKVVEVVNGGAVVLVNGVRVFVPASQTGIPKDGDLSVLNKQEVELRIIEVRDGGRDGRRGGKKIIGSIKAVQNEERRAKEAEFWANLAVGQYFTGKVKSITSYGAFVDLGSGVDGMVHTTELSWKHIKSPAEVISVGEEITVFVKSFDPEKKRISLGYKTEDTNPWYIFTHNFAVGDVASVKIVNMMPFGAFAEIVDGVDGLIHISQIAQKRIGQPSEVLSIGQVVDAKITEIDEAKKKVSLSIRVLLDEAKAAEEAAAVEAGEALGVIAEETAAEAPAEEAAPVVEEAPAEEAVAEEKPKKKRTTKKAEEAAEEAPAEEKPKKRTTKKKAEETPAE